MARSAFVIVPFPPKQLLVIVEDVVAPLLELRKHQLRSLLARFAAKVEVLQIGNIDGVFLTAVTLRQSGVCNLKAFGNHFE